MIASPQISNNWDVIEYFENPSNEELLNALACGTSALRINFSKALNLNETEALLEGIHFHFIECYFLGDPKTVQLAEKLAKKSNSDEIFIFSNVNFAEEQQQFLEQAKSFLEQDPSTSSPRVSFQMSPAYLDNITKIRAIKILWNHLLQSFNLSTPNLKVDAVISDLSEITELEEHYIHASIQLMSSVIASVDGIEISIPKKGQKSNEFRRRISRNLHHLASLESRMDLVRDPLKGSYFIEERSNAYAKEAWNKFTL